MAISSTYRTDIDALRAIAVLIVILFHMDVPGFEGGFIGVDIFFVISGYLITKSLIKEYQGNRVSLTSFYRRRILRILPVLCVCLVSVIAGSFFLLTPSQFLETGKAFVYATIFISNFFFYGVQNDYWAQGDLGFQPLLHTWSLAVEEQFYIVFPLLFLGFATLSTRVSEASRPRIALVLIGILTTLSLAYSEAILAHDTPGAFYLPQSRAWEILAGALIAFIPSAERISKPILNCLTIIGFILISYSFGTLSDGSPFPGLIGLPVVLGSGLLIFAGQSTFSQYRLTKALAAIGLISYSLYIWHWPIIIFTESAVWSARGLPKIEPLILRAVIFIVSILSWRFIEQPFRRKVSISNFRLFSISFSILTFLLFIGYQAVKIGGGVGWVKQPMPRAIQKIDEVLSLTPGAKCEGSDIKETILQNGGGCAIGYAAAPTFDFAVIGDSHARMWTSGLDSMGKENRTKILGLMRSSCTPLLGISPPARPECRLLTEASLEYVSRHELDLVVLAGYWKNLYETMSLYTDENDNVVHVSQNNRTDVFQAALARTVGFLHAAGKKVVVMLDVPTNTSDPYSEALKSANNDGAPQLLFSTPENRPGRDPANLLLARFAESYGYSLINPTSYVCKGESCLIATGGIPLYRDGHHLTDYGAIYFSSALREINR